MPASRHRLARFLSDSEPAPEPGLHCLTDFYREELIKCQRCLELHREYYSERAIHDVEVALARAGGSRTRAAAELGLSRQGLLKTMTRLGLDARPET